jgi:hypothetical protein
MFRSEPEPRRIPLSSKARAATSLLLGLAVLLVAAPRARRL